MKADHRGTNRSAREAPRSLEGDAHAAAQGEGEGDGQEEERDQPVEVPPEDRHLVLAIADGDRGQGALIRERGLGAILWGEIDQPTPNYSPLWGLILSLAGFPAYALWSRSRPRPRG